MVCILSTKFKLNQQDIIKHPIEQIVPSLAPWKTRFIIFIGISNHPKIRHYFQNIYFNCCITVNNMIMTIPMLNKVYF